ncbi:MATH and LRR domain-containing protein PFE0570w [Condylostylus longicornis]|uniref:MATH and LRR domain-containing protein PFE0570w n=1 Tax=Condylostylus longicornis TaxID=2530218 RepID=UPI00244E35E4|nr:MATH and LRR domain-containing protein PFE0570w [Condylostylus longicornis]
MKMLKIALKQKISICSFYLILFITTNFVFDNIECGIIRREISLKNETSTDTESEILKEQNEQATATTIRTITPEDSKIIIKNINNHKDEVDLSNFRTEITTVSETRSESISIGTKPPLILSTTKKLNLINNNSDISNNNNNKSDNNNNNNDSNTKIITTTTTKVPLLSNITVENSNIVNKNVNINKETTTIVNKINEDSIVTKENVAKNNFQTTEPFLNIVQMTTTTPATTTVATHIVNDPITTIKQDLFRHDPHQDIGLTTLEPPEETTKSFEDIDYDEHRISTTPVTITSSTDNNQHILETTIQKHSILENELNNKTINQTHSMISETVIKNENDELESKPDNSKPTFIKATLEKIENELLPSSSVSPIPSLPPKLEKNNIKIQGRSHHDNKYDEIFSEIGNSGENKKHEKNLQLKPTNKEITTISNDLEIPNAAELWALVGMKSNLPKEKLIKLENPTSKQISSSTPEYVNIEQDNSTLKHLADWTKIMEESIDMENSTSNILNNELTATTILPDSIEEKNKILIDSISNNLNENFDKENVINSTQIEMIPKLQKEEQEKVKMSSNLTPILNEKNLVEESVQQKKLNNSTESVKAILNEEKSLLSQTSNNSSDDQNNIIETIVKNQNKNNDNKILSFVNASNSDNIDKKTENLKIITNKDEIENNKNKNIKDSSSSSSSSSVLESTSISSSTIINDETTIENITPPTTTVIMPTIITTTTTVRGLPLEISFKAHPNKEDITDNLNAVSLNNAFKNNSSDKYLENAQNFDSIVQPTTTATTKTITTTTTKTTTTTVTPTIETKIINRNSNITDDFSKLLTAVVENSLNETNSILVNENINIKNNNNRENDKTADINENLNNIIVKKANESEIKNDIIITTEKPKEKEVHFETKEESKMTSRMDYDDESNFTSTTLATTGILYDKNKKNQKYLTGLLSSTSETTPSSSSTSSATIIGNEIIKKKTTTEKPEKFEIVKPTSESSIENDVIEKHQPPTIKSSLFPKLIQPTTTINPLKIPNNNEEILVENSLDIQSTLQTIPFAKDPSEILIGSPTPSLPSSEINSDFYPKYEVATTSDTKLDIINIDDNNDNKTKMTTTESTILSSSKTLINNDDKNGGSPSSTKIPYNTEGLEGASNDTDYNVIVAVSVSVVGIIALILLVGFLIVMRKRQKQTTYGQRCRPVGLDAYSMYNISIRDSIRGKSFRNSVSKRSYGNVAFDDPSLIHNPMGIHDLNRFVGKKSAIFDEFKDIPQITAKADEVPAGCEDKNRYANVIPLPETRVILQQQDGDEKTEYINANYVRGPKDSPNYYIACQAPLESTVPDFWRMIWEQNSRVIIMATDLEENGIEKCAAYIPESMILDNHVVYGDYQITLKNREVKEKYAVSTLHVKNLKTNAWREITHFWYQWPITGVPSDEAPMIAMLLEARSCLKTAANEQVDDEEIIDNNDKRNDSKTTVTPSTTKEVSSEVNKISDDNENNIKNEPVDQKENKNDNTNKTNTTTTKTLSKSQGPLLVHCSPGTGRTGTIIACDIAIRSLETPKRTVDIPQIVYYVRRGRASAIQTKEQYEFIYRVTHMYATKISAPVNEN